MLRKTGHHEAGVDASLHAEPGTELEGRADLADGGVSPAILPAGGREGGRKGGARRRGPPGSFRDGVMLFCYLDY